MGNKTVESLQKVAIEESGRNKETVKATAVLKGRKSSICLMAWIWKLDACMS